MSESAKKTSTFGDAHLHTGTQQGSASDDPTKADPTTNTPSQILLEALQNFVIPLIHTIGGKNKSDVGQIHSMGAEAGKLVIALQEFISSMIVQPQVGQAQRIEVDLADDPNVDSDSSDDETSPGVAIESNVSDPGPSGDLKLTQTEYQHSMGEVQEAVRERVFSKMPIRVLHFTNTLQDSGPKLQIMLLDRNGIYDCVMKEIHTKYPTVDTKIDSDKHSIIWDNTKYAILSHTWLRGSNSEVTYDAWQTGQFDTQKPGFQKLANFCKSAWKDHGLTFGWMDTVCINKDSSSELDESIRSMYKWYTNSDICITYLAGTIALGDIHQDPWFTRGWTLQELLAPARMTFYNKDWKMFVPYTYRGDKSNPDILDQILKATTITKHELHTSKYLPISRKMQLAAKRKVMREEDIAYSLMGICHVSISIAYGEGAERAFFRLMTEVLNTSSEVVDIFNCAQKEYFFSERPSIIPSGPWAYLRCSKDIMRARHDPPIEPLLLTHVGLRTPILLMPSLQGEDPCLENDPIGSYYATFLLPESTYTFGLESRSHLLDKGITKSAAWHRWTFGVLNFGGDTTDIHVQNLCLAVCFQIRGSHNLVDWSSTSNLSSVNRMVTDKPIVFFLKEQGSLPVRAPRVHSIKRSDLAKHGMTLKTMYL